VLVKETRSVNTKRWLTGIALLLICLLTAALLKFLFDYTEEIAVIDLKNGYVVRIWKAYPKISEGFREGGGWDVNYSISRQGVDIVPEGGLFMNVYNSDPGPYLFKTAFADNGRLICIYDANAGSIPQIMIEVSSGDTWPAHTEEEFLNPTVKKKWFARYQQIRQENPNLPNYSNSYTLSPD
jgi:hypothetical protein